MILLFPDRVLAIVLLALSILLWLSTYTALFQAPSRGFCYCEHTPVNEDCICSPSLAIEAIIELPSPQSRDISIVLVERRDPPRLLAIPGGFVNVGESVEAATIREVKEETNLELVSLEQFRVYSNPKRDQRRHTASTIFRCIPRNVSLLGSGDDAKAVRVVKLRDTMDLPLAFDHQQVLRDFISRYHPNLLNDPTKR